jgi:hypothetical protein
MKSRSLGTAICAAGVASLLLFGCSSEPTGTPPTVAQPPSITVPAKDEIAALKAEVECLKKVVPDQAHAMADVDYHFTNLWFAGTAKNWPLADFYWKESLAHIKWGVRIIPIRKDNAGKEVKLEEILQSIEQSPFMQMGEVIKKQDAEQFEPTYRRLLEGYSCHKASDKPYLRPRIPDQPASRMMNFDPKADWPN